MWVGCLVIPIRAHTDRPDVKVNGHNHASSLSIRLCVKIDSR